METQATHCFCGCGERVRNPRLVVTNTTGWELNTELVEWLKFELLGVPGCEDFVDTGQELWVSLANSLHVGERPDNLDEVNAVRWAKHSRKSRRKLKRKFRRSGMPNPFELPTSDLDELRRWITQGERPAWAEQLLEEERDDDQLDFSDIDVQQIRRQGEASYRRDLEGLNEGPDPWLEDEQQVAAARRLYEPVRTRLDAIEQGNESPYPLPGECRQFVESELAEDKLEGVDASDFEEASALGIVIGMLIREAEGSSAAPLSDDFLAALDEGSNDAGPNWTIARLRELADPSRDPAGPPDEDGHPTYSTDPLLLSLFAPGQTVWDGLEWWANEYVRLKTMPVPGIAITSPENRIKAIRFGYMLACLLERDSTQVHSR